MLLPACDQLNMQTPLKFPIDNRTNWIKASHSPSSDYFNCVNCDIAITIL